ncbi:hypothetical protein HYC85_012076 [Camellia sinensis]|uniref:Uncharacterized protein n=1 Tax=Camellia sinensis TaxID=4442 RepID=A0A7J7HAW5_CAMSI|nr:hypothetical protein HYC85_012076 [Camellia sinensis]
MEFTKSAAKILSGMKKSKVQQNKMWQAVVESHGDQGGHAPVTIYELLGKTEKFNCLPGFQFYGDGDSSIYTLQLSDTSHRSNVLHYKYRSDEVEHVIDRYLQSKYSGDIARSNWGH